MLASGIFYSLMRLMYYGALAHEAIVVKGDYVDLKSLKVKCAENIKGIISWFSCGLSWKAYGLWLSLLVGFLISLVMFIVLFVE